MDCEHKKSTRVTMNHALPSKKLRNATLFHLRVLGHFPSWLHRQPRGTQCQRQSVARKERETLVKGAQARAKPRNGDACAVCTFRSALCCAKLHLSHFI